MIKRPFKIILAAVISFAFMLIIYFRLGFFYETNDDRLIAEILSGAMCGTPNAHTVYVNYLLSLPLSFLYCITTQIPWYGGMLLLFQFLFYFAVINSFFSRCRNILELFISSGLCCCIFLINIYVIALTQYTSTAILLALAGYISLLLAKKQKEGFIFFIILEFLSFMLRSESMLLIQPIGASICLGYYFAKNSFHIKNKEFLYFFSMGHCISLYFFYRINK